VTGGASANDTQHEASAMTKATRFNLVVTISPFPVPIPFLARIRSVQRIESEGGGSADNGGDPAPHARRRRRACNDRHAVAPARRGACRGTRCHDQARRPGVASRPAPNVPSSELSRVVVAVADDVDDGEHVTPFDRDGLAAGTPRYRPGFLHRRRGLGCKPATLSDVEGATISPPALSAWQGLFDTAVSRPVSGR
jgi:hypothetical protein